jgi:hypothetical protein
LTTPLRGYFSGPIVPRRALLLAASLASFLLAAGPAWGAGLQGVWVAKGAAGKIVLRLHGSGSTYRGTYTEARKVARVVARLTDADGVQQVTLTFTASRRSSLCGINAGRLYCQTAGGASVFVRS